MGSKCLTLGKCPSLGKIARLCLLSQGQESLHGLRGYPSCLAFRHSDSHCAPTILNHSQVPTLLPRCLRAGWPRLECPVSPSTYVYLSNFYLPVTILLSYHCLQKPDFGQDCEGGSLQNQADLVSNLCSFSSHIISLNFSFLIYKIGAITANSCKKKT